MRAWTEDEPARGNILGVMPGLDPGIHTELRRRTALRY